MVSPKTQKIFIALVVLLLLGFLGYKLFVQAPVVDQTVAASETDTVGQDILVLVGKLNALSIDQNILSSSMFINLIDFTQTIFPEPRGRMNPFAPVGSDGNLSISTLSQNKATSTTGR
jgi:hypothetical protein